MTIRETIQKIDKVNISWVDKMSIIEKTFKDIILLIRSSVNFEEADAYIDLLDELAVVSFRFYLKEKDEMGKEKIEISNYLISIINFFYKFDRLDVLEERKFLVEEIKQGKEPIL